MKLQMLLFEMFSASSDQMGLTKNRAKAGCWCNSSFFNKNPGDFSFSLHSPNFLSASMFLQLFCVAVETGMTRSNWMSLTHFLIYRHYPFEHMNSSRSQREAQEMLAVKELSLLNSQFPAQSQSLPAVISGARRRMWPQENRRAKLLAVHCPFHCNQCERQEMKQALLP